jgi:choline dehydrogenase
MKSLATAIRSNNTAFYSLDISGSASPGGVSVLLHPLSRGTVNINVTSPNDTEPIVDYRALTNPIDVEILVEFIRFTREYHFNTTLSAYGPQEMAPGQNVVGDEELAEYVRQRLTPTEYHPSGTCAMMPKELGGVVDENLMVYGVKGLRVVDASVFPTLPGANTCQTVYAIAEKVRYIVCERPTVSPMLIPSRRLI